MQRIVDADKATLEHWGIKGMKWGFRRFQNKDGSLTAAGRKRYGKSAEGGKNTSASNKSKSKSSSGKSSGKSSSSSEESDGVTKYFVRKKPSQMTDEELTASINRLALEKRYNDLLPKFPEEAQKQKSLGRRFFEKTRDDVVIPALTQSAKNALSAWLEKSFKDALGLNAKDQKAKEKEYLDNLQQEVKRLTLEQQKRKLKGG